MVFRLWVCRSRNIDRHCFGSLGQTGTPGSSELVLVSASQVRVAQQQSAQSNDLGGSWGSTSLGRYAVGAVFLRDTVLAAPCRRSSTVEHQGESSGYRGSIPCDGTIPEVVQGQDASVAPRASDETDVQLVPSGPMLLQHRSNHVQETT